MADAVLWRDGPVAVPLSYTVPQVGELAPLSVRATIDGTGAGAAFYAVVQVLDPNGRVMFNAISSSIAAGGSADVSWFPGLGGSSGSAAAGAVASAFLYSQTPHTFSGSVGFSATWEHFSTTDTSVFGTLPFNSFAPPPTNQPGDVNLVLLKDGAYAVSASALFAPGSESFFGQVQLQRADYLTNGHTTAIGALPTTTPAMSGEGQLMTYDVQLFTLPQTWAPETLYLLLEGQTTANYTVNAWSLVCHYFGSGIGADDQVY